MTNTNDTLSQAEREAIENLAGTGFEGLTTKYRDTADFYAFTLPSKRECYLKLFHPDDVELYLIENHALRSLTTTGRVSPVLYSYPDPFDPDPPPLGRRCFLVKPRFKNFLYADGKRPRLLDDAAQLVSLAEMMKKEGWYDFDENWENEAFDDEGQMIRFDMDAAFNYKSLSPKSNRIFHAPVACDQRDKLSEACHLLGREEVVLLSVAVKTCRYFLSRRGNCPELDSHLAVNSHNATADGGAAAAPGVRARWPGKVGAALARFLRSLSGTSPSQHVSIQPPAKASPAEVPAKTDEPSEKEEKEWLALWVKRLVNDPGPGLFPLSTAEANFLGLLFAHVLRGKAADWKLEDFRHSLLLLLAGNLQRFAAEYAVKDLQVFRKLVEELYAFKQLTLPQAHEIVNRPKAEPPGPYKVLKIARDKVALAGGAWPANRKQGMGGCEDLVLKYAQAPSPFFVLADGETNAKGGDAIKVLEKECQRLYEEMSKTPDAHKPKEWIALLVRRANEALLKIGARTTMVVAMLSNGPPASVMLAQFGNSPWVFIKDDAAGGPPHPQVNPRNCDEKVLGKAPITSDEWITDEIIEPPLEVGSYHVRAHSDGIPNNQRDVFKETTPVGELVDQVSRWSRERPGEVGYDDWSVAGFDFTVSEEMVEPAKSKRETQPVAPGAIDWLDVCERITPEPFKLSEPAQAFWQHTLGRGLCKELREYAVFKEAGLVVAEMVAAEATEDQKPETPEVQKPETPKPDPAAATTKPTEKTEKPVSTRRLSLSDFWYWLRRNVGVVVAGTIITGGLIAMVYLIWLYLYGDTGSNTNSNTQTAVTSDAPLPTPTPQFNDPFTRDLFNSLNKDIKVAYGQLAPGDGVDDEPLRTIIPAIAEILRKTQWSLKLEIHTSISGTQAANFETAKSRGAKIVARIKDMGLAESRVSFESKGSTDPRFPRPKNYLEEQDNRRIVIGILK